MYELIIDLNIQMAFKGVINARKNKSLSLYMFILPFCIFHAAVNTNGHF